jgi:general secretion pathway protein C
MGRYLSWIANTTLFVLGCFLVANTANTVVAALMTPEPTVAAAVASAPPETGQRSWSEREVILQRNLFNASLIAPPVAPLGDEPEDLEATRLPLRLLGTLAATRPELSWAAIEDLKKRDTLIVRNRDPVADGAEVVRIERRRVVLLENGEHRELTLDEDENDGDKARVTRQRARRPRRQAPRDTAARVRALARDRFEVPREDVQAAVRNPASIFSQAQIQPEYEDGAMIGMRVNAIKPGSLFEEVGIQNGAIILELNGIAIDSPEASGQILSEFAEAQEFTVVVENPDGEEEVKTFQIPAGEE